MLSLCETLSGYRVRPGGAAEPGRLRPRKVELVNMVSANFSFLQRHKDGRPLILASQGWGLTGSRISASFSHVAVQGQPQCFSV